MAWEAEQRNRPWSYMVTVILLSRYKLKFSWKEVTDYVETDGTFPKHFCVKHFSSSCSILEMPNNNTSKLKKNALEVRKRMSFPDRGAKKCPWSWIPVLKQNQRLIFWHFQFYLCDLLIFHYLKKYIMFWLKEVKRWRMKMPPSCLFSFHHWYHLNPWQEEDQEGFLLIVFLPLYFRQFRFKCLCQEVCQSNRGSAG